MAAAWMPPCHSLWSRKGQAHCRRTRRSRCTSTAISNVRKPATICWREKAAVAEKTMLLEMSLIQISLWPKLGCSSSTCVMLCTCGGMACVLSVSAASAARSLSARPMLLVVHVSLCGMAESLPLLLLRASVCCLSLSLLLSSPLLSSAFSSPAHVCALVEQRTATKAERGPQR